MPTKKPAVKKKSARSPYDVHPGVAMIQKWVAELPDRTGRSLEQWADVARRKDLPTAKEKREWLKAECGLGTNAAWWIVEYAEGVATWDADPESYLAAAAGYVDGMFGKGKEWQRPIFEEVVAFARTLGPDVKVCPCQTIVPLYRARVFAELKPATKTRLELSFALGEVPITGALRPNPRAKGNDRLRYQIAIAGPADFNAAARKWLKAAYVQDAK